MDSRDLTRRAAGRAPLARPDRQRLRDGETPVIDETTAALNRELEEANRDLSELVYERSSQLKKATGELLALRRALSPPDLPEAAGLDMAVALGPAEHSVAGDFHLVRATDGRTMVLFGDMQGHGIEAARDATFARAVLGSIARNTTNPGTILRLANDILADAWAGEHRFVTAICLAHDPQERRVRWSLAGHPPPLRLRDGTSLNGEHRGPPLGVDPDAWFGVHDAELPAGEGLLLFTDGVTDARHQGESFGIERLADGLRRRAGAEPSRIVAELHHEVAKFCNGRPPDDLCLLALRATG